MSLALGHAGEHREGPVDLKREVPARNQKSHFGPEPEDPDREVAQPSGGIGGLHQVVSEHKFFICRLQVKERGRDRELRVVLCV
jgi:hypothetical protein